MLTAVLGLVFGSFLNVCITRLPEDESLATPRSHCRNCRRTLRWFENIPVASWLVLRGRCRTCGSPISWRYPLVEAALAALWVECLLHFGATLFGLHAAVFCFLLLGLAFTDLETYLLPDVLTLGGLAIGFAFSIFVGTGPWHGVQNALVGAVLGAGVLLLIAGTYYLVRRKQGIGMGDVKLLAMIGAFLGSGNGNGNVLLVFFLGTIATAVAALIWLVIRRVPAKWTQQPMPYGTFLAAAGIFALFWGRQLFVWYMRKLT